jgi:hypothetical protein
LRAAAGVSLREAIWIRQSQKFSELAKKRQHADAIWRKLTMTTMRQGQAVMPTATMLRSQLTELRMMVDRDDPVQIEAEAAFAAMVAEIIHEAEIAENIAMWKEEQMSEPLAKPLALRSAEPFDPLAAGNH